MGALVKHTTHYTAKKAFFSFLGNTFRIFGQDGSLQYYIKQKAFTLKEQIHVYGDEAQTDAKLSIAARGIMDFSGAYDITDATTGEVVGGGQRKGFKSLFKDEWAILDKDGIEAGKVVEVGGIMILIRKFFKFIPQRYDVIWMGDKVGHINQGWNPIQLSYDVQFNSSGEFDPRVGVGMVVLLLAIEGRDS